jgi:hypothetical protein
MIEIILASDQNNCIQTLLHKLLKHKMNSNWRNLKLK